LLVLREYQKIAEKGSAGFADYVTYSEETIERVFGKEKAVEIVGENQNDAAANITEEKLRTRFERIVAEIKKLPKAEQLEELYKKAEIKANLSDIDVSDEKVELLLKYAPMVRNRLTLLRLMSRGAVFTN